MTIKLNLGCCTCSKYTQKHTLLLGQHLHLWNEYTLLSFTLSPYPSDNERELLHADALLFHLHSDLPDLGAPVVGGFLGRIQGFEKISLTSVERLVDVQPALHAF